MQVSSHLLSPPVLHVATCSTVWGHYNQRLIGFLLFCWNIIQKLHYLITWYIDKLFKSAITENMRFLSSCTSWIPLNESSLQNSLTERTKSPTCLLLVDCGWIPAEPTQEWDSPLTGLRNKQSQQCQQPKNADTENNISNIWQIR